ncbi:MAG: penicillin-binding protein activator, partial [Alphaproteobacteria bacterium]|nr:penicillin-binding protein activator [Alphaproteobacteria bacterium]
MTGFPVSRWTDAARAPRIRPLPALLVLPLLLLAAACASLTQSPAPVRGAPQATTSTAPAVPAELPAGTWTDEARFIRPPHMAGRQPVRVGLLLPLSGPNTQAAEIGRSLLNAAELAIFQVNNPDLLLLPEDTRGDPDGAREAAQRALDAGAEILLGPLFADHVTAVAPLARSAGVPVVALSSDRAVAGSGVFLLSFQAEDEVDRVTEFAASQGLNQIAALVPQGNYGLRVQRELEEVAGQTGAQVVSVVSYYPGAENFLEPTAQLASLYKSQALPPFNAVLIPEGGTTLRGLAPLLPYNDIDNRVVRFLGTGLWDDPSLWREPSLYGGWFAAPDPAGRRAFAARYAEVHG